MKNIVVDTDILINFLRGKEKAKEFLLSLVEDLTIYMLCNNSCRDLCRDERA